ncbi:HNH endonuclease [Streptomyces sp. NBC_00728]|uniref:HNH endonuclease n=1 Tax=Streptomyces sp. NBC_00728 TaxID=2903676 RepID=UPI0038660683
MAQEVWGVDGDNATWEHIMALGDVEEFPAPVPAAPILHRLNVPAPLRSLTLRTAEDYRRATRLLPARHRPVHAESETTRPLPSPRLTTKDLLDRISSLGAHRFPEDGSSGRDQSLAMLWAVSRIAAGKPRLAPWASFHAELRPLLAAFGLPDSKVGPESPFCALPGSGLWEVHGIESGSSSGSLPETGTLDTVQPVAGLTHASAELLQDPPTRLEVVVKLCSTHLDDVDQRALLSQVGLAGYATADGLLDEDENSGGQEVAPPERANGPAARRERTSSSLVRNAAIANAVKELHGHTCQVCETRLRYKRRPYSEAAHIRGLGSPHDGPDEQPNLLCLCPNHHVLFDGLEIYVDVDGIVRQTHGGDSLGHLRRHADHWIDEEYLHYHRTLCELNRLTKR